MFSPNATYRISDEANKKSFIKQLIWVSIYRIFRLLISREIGIQLIFIVSKILACLLRGFICVSFFKGIDKSCGSTGTGD